VQQVRQRQQVRCAAGSTAAAGSISRRGTVQRSGAHLRTYDSKPKRRRLFYLLKSQGLQGPRVRVCWPNLNGSSGCSGTAKALSRQDNHPPLNLERLERWRRQRRRRVFEGGGAGITLRNRFRSEVQPSRAGGFRAATVNPNTAASEPRPGSQYLNPFGLFGAMARHRRQPVAAVAGRIRGWLACRSNK
jgi:hypothetical protein